MYDTRHEPPNSNCAFADMWLISRSPGDLFESARCPYTSRNIRKNDKYSFVQELAFAVHTIATNRKSAAMWNVMNSPPAATTGSRERNRVVEMETFSSKLRRVVYRLHTVGNRCQSHGHRFTAKRRQRSVSSCVLPFWQ